MFADETYRGSDVSCFLPKMLEPAEQTGVDTARAARMHKAIAIIQFKLEGQTIRRNPSFHMDDRLLLDKIDFEKGTVTLPTGEYKLRDCDFPTIDPADPYPPDARRARPDGAAEELLPAQ